MILPRWMRTRSQPVAADDVVEALLEAGQVPLSASAWYDLPGPEVLSGKEILERAAGALGLRQPTSVRLRVELVGYRPRAGRAWPVSLMYRLQAALHPGRTTVPLELRARVGRVRLVAALCRESLCRVTHRPSAE